MQATEYVSHIFAEKGFGSLKIEFVGDDGVAVVPNTDTIKWTLTNRPTSPSVAATIINSRELVAVTSASTIYINLEGEDLSLLVGETSTEFNDINYTVDRVLMIQFQYDSATLGNNLDGKIQIIFKVGDFYYVGSPASVLPIDSFENEIPIGTVDGVNNVFTLTKTPFRKSAFLVVNGAILREIIGIQPGQFTRSGLTVTITDDFFIPDTDDSFFAMYMPNT